MIEHLDLGCMLLIAGIGIFAIATVISVAIIHHGRFDQWAKRDEELMQQWNTAFDSRDYDECKRLAIVMRENWQSYRRNA